MKMNLTLFRVGVFCSFWFYWRKNIDRLRELKMMRMSPFTYLSCCLQNLRDFFVRIIGPLSWLLVLQILSHLGLFIGAEPSFSIASISGVLSYTSCRIHKINVENMENTSTTSRASYTTVTTNQPWTVSFSKMLKSKQAVDVE